MGTDLIMNIKTLLDTAIIDMVTKTGQNPTGITLTPQTANILINHFCQYAASGILEQYLGIPITIGQLYGNVPFEIYTPARQFVWEQV